MTRFLILFLALLLPSDSERAEHHFQQATRALAAGQSGEALNHYEAALRLQPDSLRYGSEYRQAVIRDAQYDRCLEFFEQLVTDHPKAPNAYLNFGFAYVDKIPASGAITQVILANTALGHFTESLELRSSWAGYYTRGNSYLFWPKIFNRTHLGVADLKEALKIQNSGEKRSYHSRAYVALGDGYSKMDQLEQARESWKKGMSLFPDDPQLKQRLALEGEALEELISGIYDPNKRVDTDLKELWSQP